MKAVPHHHDTLFSYLLGGPDLAGKKIVDLFAGGGGVSAGIEAALGRSPDVAINHDEEAIAMHQVNHPLTRHYRTDVFEVDPHEAVGDAPVALLWLSPDCKHHSPAKGGKPLDQRIRSLAWVAHKWAGKKRPDVIVLENVPAFQNWGRLVAQRGKVDAENKKVTQPWPNKPKRQGKGCRRWKRGMAKQRPPRGPVMYSESGQQLKVADKRPRYQGRTFRAFVQGLERLGYVVEYRTLVAADYGVPTIRERFFLIARRDGRRIVWPEPTHAPADDPRVLRGELLPWVPASACIDWDLPIPSVFPATGGRAKALKPKSLRRIALGVRKFVLNNPRPFLVQLAHGGHDSRQIGTEHPAWTITGGEGVGVVQPCIVPMNADNPACSAEEPLRTVTTGNRFDLTPAFVPSYYGEKGMADGRGQTLEQPLATVRTGNCHGVVACHITQYNSGGLAPEHASYGLDRPVRTVTAQGGRQFLTAAALVRMEAYGSNGSGLGDDSTRSAGGATKRGNLAPFGAPQYRQGGSCTSTPRGSTSEKWLPWSASQFSKSGFYGFGTSSGLDCAGWTDYRISSYQSQGWGQAQQQPQQSRTDDKVREHEARLSAGIESSRSCDIAGDGSASLRLTEAGPFVSENRQAPQHLEGSRAPSLHQAFWINQYNGTATGQDAQRPIPTLSTVERFGVMTAHMLRNFGSSDARPADAPLASQTAVVKDGVVVGHLGPALSAHQSAQASKVYGLLREHCPEALTHLSPEDHARQLVTLTLQGEKFVLWDIGMRMLTPRELYRCQGFDDRYVIDFSVKGRPLSKDSQTRMCGNSVPPRMVSALIGAQFSQPMSEAAD